MGNTSTRMLQEELPMRCHFLGTLAWVPKWRVACLMAGGPLLSAALLSASPGVTCPPPRPLLWHLLALCSTGGGGAGGIAPQSASLVTQTVVLGPAAQAAPKSVTDADVLSGNLHFSQAPEQPECPSEFEEQ